MVVDWATVSALVTGGGTLVLAAATFASVRSANRAARTAERSLLVGLRPLIMTSRLQDPSQKVMFVDRHWVKVDGGCAVVEVTDQAIYLVVSVRNAGNGLAVLHGWSLYPRLLTTDAHGDPDAFRRLTRDLYIAPGDIGFWQGAFRDPNAEEFAEARAGVEAREGITVELLYGDHEGGQRTISRFALLPRDDGGWIASVARHWSIDGADPR
jgi:hypothetical protein